ncbi:hypothetical protein M433DRAFT_225408 [Acidomyces richmondensis BFW]|nr:MAG: hypothetical protein FE78DRAFT_374419 [Acidomyces sp. 'richmondensis']KYG46041.1 hypothetical protein M433DRAFT_225408 [Acidomyces richmondensis BFW]
MGCIPCIPPTGYHYRESKRMSQTTENKSQWFLYAIASGACAALNGAFAKLTTTHLTSSWASNLSHILGVEKDSKAMEWAVRALFFLMNLTFNAIMWGMFTQALTLANSTVRVSVINTSANFILTAFLGALVFSENLPGLWWVGASFLVVGSVIIGRREEEKDLVAASSGSTNAATPRQELHEHDDKAPGTHADRGVAARKRNKRRGN